MQTERLSIQGAAARYEPLLKLASGGMATVYVGRLIGALGFQRLVAIKRPHLHLLEDPRFVKMLLDEASLASRLQHANVVSVQDVVRADASVYLVMDLVEGASLAELTSVARARDERIFPNVYLRVLLDTCAGLHAAHELLDDDGQPMGLVHRDVSPHNVLVGLDGVARVSDFGIAKCVNVHGASTSTGTLKGKYPYMAPEYIRGLGVDRRADVFSLAVVAWEQLAKRRLFRGESPPATMLAVVQDQAPLLSEACPGFTTVFDEPLARALSKEPEDRFPTARAFGEALEEAARSISMIASATAVGNVVQRLVGTAIAERKQHIREILQKREAEGIDHERPTEPLPGGGPSNATVSSRVTYDVASSPAERVDTEASVSRPAVIPELAQGSSNATEMSAIAPQATRPARKGRVWLIVGAALLVGGGATWGVQHLAASANVPAAAPPEPAEAEGLAASAVPSNAPDAEGNDAGPDVVDAAVDAGRKHEPVHVAPTPRERLPKDPPTRVEPDAAAPAPTIKKPPPNPYGAASGG